MGIMRIGHAAINVMDIDAAVKHYEKILGMNVTHHDATGRVYLKCWDEWDKYSIILFPDNRAGLAHVAYKVEHDADLDILQKRIEDYGIQTRMHPPGTLALCGRSLFFTLPSGHEMYLYAEKEFVGTDVGFTNPDPWPDSIHGIGVHWLDHVALVAEVNHGKGINRVAESTKFACEVLDFRLVEQILTGADNTMHAAFLTRTNTPHDLALVGGSSCGFHHAGFFLDDWAQILRTGDILSKNRVRISMTPNRHGITRGETVYFFDPSGNRNESFAGLGYLSQPDMPTVTWTEDAAIQRGLFYLGRPDPAFFNEFT